MSRNGTGGYNLPVNSWNPAVNGVAATATDWQSLINDVAASIQQSVSSDGQTAMTGPLNMGGNKLTSVANGSNSGDAVNYGQFTTYLSDSSGASKVGYLPAGVGAVATNVQTVLRERVSIRDFGAVDGTDIAAAVSLGLTYLSGIDGGVLDFVGITATCSALTLSGLSNITLRGNGAKLSKPVGSGSNSLIFNIKGGCTDVTVEGFADLDGGYDSSNNSTGSNPVILIGDQTGAGDGGNTNRRIKVFGNRIRRSNWAGIVVYGRSNNAVTITPKNQDIKIFANSIEDTSGNGVFVYKNAADVFIFSNTIDTVGQDGIAIDTKAASDTVTSEAINNVVITGNTVRNFGKNLQGIGVLVKGLVSNTTIVGNTVTDGLVQSTGSLINYGIFANVDAGGNSPDNITMSGNTVKNIQGSLSGMGLQVGSGVSNATVTGNTVSICTSAGIYVNTLAKNITVTGNSVKSCGNLSYGYRFVGSSGNEIRNLNVSGNTFEKGTSTAVGGYQFTYVIDGRETGNLAPDFSSPNGITNCTNLYSINEITGTAVPSTGTYALGTICINTNVTTINPVDSWRCVIAGSPGTWRAASWITPKAPTANRPTLTASDIGVSFLDTSLSGNGKPIFWTGSLWVDSAGTSV